MDKGEYHKVVLKTAVPGSVANEPGTGILDFKDEKKFWQEANGVNCLPRVLSLKTEYSWVEGTGRTHSRRLKESLDSNTLSGIVLSGLREPGQPLPLVKSNPSIILVMKAGVSYDLPMGMA